MQNHGCSLLSTISTYFLAYELFDFSQDVDSKAVAFISTLPVIGVSENTTIDLNVEKDGINEPMQFVKRVLMHLLRQLLCLFKKL